MVIIYSVFQKKRMFKREIQVYLKINYILSMDLAVVEPKGNFNLN